MKRYRARERQGTQHTYTAYMLTITIGETEKTNDEKKSFWKNIIVNYENRRFGMRECSIKWFVDNANDGNDITVAKNT